MTDKHRVQGQLYVPPEQSLATYLNGNLGELLRIANPMLYTAGFTHPPLSRDLKMAAGFLALHQTQVLWLLGGQQDPRPDWEKMVVRRMAFLFESYLLIGDLALSSGLRSSDYLRGAKPFQTLFNVALYPWQISKDRAIIFNKTMNTVFEVSHAMNDASPVIELSPASAFPFVTVNLTQAVGVLEPPQAKLDQPRYVLVK
jgi:hypothetical protein